MCSKPLSRIALAVHDHLAALTANDSLIELPLDEWQRCVDVVRRIRRARLRGWNLAGTALTGDLRYSLPAVEQELAAIRGRLAPSPRPDYLVRPGTIYCDLIALRREFAALDHDVGDRWLSVTTEPIKLREVYLGAFEIRLAWGRTRDGRPSYRIIARDPHPAAGRENVTHPHVQDEHLCEGEARYAIRAALTQGRLLDFFMLVAAVLRTYNAESPFVELSVWLGSSCSDCGAAVDDDESYSCRRCDGTACSECERVCGGCEMSFCADCIGSCDACRESHCGCSLKPCPGCRSQCCVGCLDEFERCPNCHEQESEESNGIETSNSSADSAPVQSDRLGQAPVSAGRG